MSTRLLVIQVFCYGVIYFLFQVTWCDCEVTWVTRNITDSFRIGQDGCLKNESVCTLHQASCQDDGSCLCNKDNPHFRNPIILLDGTPRYGSSYGCINETAIRFIISGIPCRLRPYQVIPNEHKEPATQFVIDRRAKSCEFPSFEVKFPNNNIWTGITWINETYFQLNLSTSTLSFLWKKSVPELKGLIITITLFCNYDGNYYTRECLQAKVLGTWSSPDFHPTTEFSAWPLSTSSKWYSTSSKKPSNLPSLTTVLSGKSNESNNSTIVIAILSFFLVLVIILSLVLGFLFHKLRQKNRMLGERVNSEEMKSHTARNSPNATYEVPLQDYATLGPQGNEVEHVYQGLVGSQKEGDNIKPNSNSPSVGYENPSAHEDYEELKDKRRDSAGVTTPLTSIQRLKINMCTPRNVCRPAFRNYIVYLGE